MVWFVQRVSKNSFSCENRLSGTQLQFEAIVTDGSQKDTSSRREVVSGRCRQHVNLSLWAKSLVFSGSTLSNQTAVHDCLSSVKSKSKFWNRALNFPFASDPHFFEIKVFLVEQ